MMPRIACKVATRLPLYVGALLITAYAQAQSRSYLDLSAGGGASSNPNLRVDGRGSAFGRLSALGVHEWRTERTTAIVSGFGESTSYFDEYGTKQIFDVNANALHALSPNVSVTGQIGFQGDFGGQLSNRFGTIITDPILQPVDLDPVGLNDPTLIEYSGRHYRVSANVGTTWRQSERNAFSASVGAQRNFATGGQSDSSYNSYFASGAYDRQLDERTSVGLRTNVSWQDYDLGNSARVINPSVTARRQFSERMVGTAAAGVLFIRQEGAGRSYSSVDPSFSLSLCRTGDRDRFCGRASRDARSSIGFGPTQASSLFVSTSAAIDYSRRLDADQTVQASLGAVRSASQRESIEGDIRTTYLTFLAGYDRKVRRRVAVGVTVGARKLYQAGADPKPDFNTTGYLRYRLGDIL